MPGGEGGSELRYARYKWTTFLSLYAGYTLVILNRKSFTFALPAVIATGTLDKHDLGLIASSQNLAYSLSKFLGGVLSDTLDAKRLFAGGLLLTGLTTVLFTGFESAGAFAALWFVQGLVQGGAWPAAAKILRQWVREDVFGTWYACLLTTLNVAGGVGPLLTAHVLAQHHWTASMHLYGLAGVGVACAGMLTITRCPADAGLVNAAKRSDDTGRSRGRGRGTWRDMLGSPFLGVLCGSYLVVSLTRTAALDWAQLYLIQDTGQTAYMGSMFISCMEMGGVLGSLVAGFAADKLVAMSKREDTRGTPRMMVVTACFVVALISMHLLLSTVWEGVPQAYIAVLGAGLGFGLYGPMALYGVMAIEAAPTHLSGTSHAIVALAANVGAVLAGLPFSWVARRVAWWGAFAWLEALMALTLVLKLLTRHVPYKLVPVRKKLE